MLLLFEIIIFGLLVFVISTQRYLNRYKKIVLYVGLFLLVQAILSFKLWFFMIMLLIVLSGYLVTFCSKLDNNEN